MKIFKRVFIFIVLVTVIFAHLDWDPIHQSYQKYGTFPHESVNEWWPKWSAFRYILGHTVCPPCAALAEHYYFVFFELQASIDEQNDLLLSHAPYSGNLVRPSPDGFYFWWGQGGKDNSNPWKKVSVLAWWLYWFPITVAWWWLYANDVFHARWPWILRFITGHIKKKHSPRPN